VVNIRTCIVLKIMRIPVETILN